jgi:hypothetical protein
VAAAGGSVVIQVQPNGACPWTATSDAGWIRISAGAEGLGEGSVTLAVDANSGVARSARVVVAGVGVGIDQASGVVPGPTPPAPPPAPSCSYSIQPAGQTIAASGGPGAIDVTTTASTCAWTAVSNNGWIAVTGGASAAGTGRATFNVSVNSGGSRTGTISIAGHLFTLTQAGVSCSYSINPSSDAMSAGGGVSTVAVSSGNSCAWTAASNASWITVASGSPGTGAGTVKLNVAANTGTARTGTATIAAQTFTVTQAAAPCGFAIAPSSLDVPAAGADRSTNVTAGTGCAWSAVSNVSWITITTPSSGTGNGVVGIHVSANGGAARSGTVTIGGQTLTVTQQAVPCAYAIAPGGETVGSAGGAGSIAVTTGPSCGWTATSNNMEWLTVTGGAAGTGNGSVTFAVSQNGGPQRVGTLTIGGQTFTVTQDAACTFAVSPPSASVGAAAGSGSFAVTTGGSCGWTAESSSPEWLSISSGSAGTGSGQVVFNVAANGTGVDRTGTIAVNGVPFSLTQTAQ